MIPKFKSKFYLIFLLFNSNIIISNNYDVTIISRIMHADGLIRLGIGFIEHFQNDLKINFIPSGIVDLKFINTNISKIIKNSDKSAGNVAFLLDHLWYEAGKPADLVPQNSRIKLAYSMHETTKVPEQWVKILNQKFDALIVPDNFLIDLYSKAGVTIPIFVLPWGLYLESFLNKPIKIKAHKPFVFGLSASFWDRKNYLMLIDAFAQEFGNNPNFYLKLHGRFGLPEAENKIIKKIKQYNLKNLSFIKTVFTPEQYINFLSSLDCYVLLSKGEGYSIGPREAMALGIPCILTNNTAQETICNSGFVRVVESKIYEPCIDFYKHFQTNDCGLVLNCNIKDVRIALKDVYNNYNFYLEKAKNGRNWVKQYLFCNLRNKFLTLIKPKKVILGEKNIIEENYLLTNSKDLYDKYLCISEKL